MSRRALILGPSGLLASCVLDALGPDATMASPRYSGAGEVAAHVDATRPDVVVHVAVVDPTPETPVTAMEEVEWDRRAELPLRAALWVLQAAYRHRARVVIVIPTVGMEGGAGLVALATGAEGVRLLAKSAARRWGAEGITVNVVAVPADAFGVAAPDATRTPPALAPSQLAGARAVASFLATTDSITGVTICADDGALMAP